MKLSMQHTRGCAGILCLALVATVAQFGPATLAQDGSAPRRTVVDDMRDRDRLLWGRAVARMQEMADQARAAVAENRYDDARSLADSAYQTVEANKGYAQPASEYDTARAAAVALKQEVEDAARAYEGDQAAREQVEIRDRIVRRKQLHDQQRAEKIDQLFNTADQLRQEQRYGEAAQVLREILYIDPANAKAQYQLEVSEDFESIMVQKGLDKEFHFQSRRTAVNTGEAKIPWDYEVLYPKNWQQIVAKRGGAAVGVVGGDEDRELNRRLDETLPDTRFEEVPFETVMDSLSEMKKLNIAVDWQDLENSGVHKDTPVSIRVKDLSVSTVLKEIISQVGGDDTALGFRVADGLIRVATREKLDREKSTRVYDVRDLLVSIPRFLNTPRIDPAQPVSTLDAAGGGGFNGGSFFQTVHDDLEKGRPELDRPGIGDPIITQQLMDIIREQVAPDSWRETGGGDGSLRELNGNLIVYNTSDAHRQIGDLLGQLRETRALQIAIETRFLTVSQNFLEEIGVDLDFVLNNASAGFDRAFTPGAGGVPTPAFDPFTGAPVLIPRQFTQIGATPGIPAFGNPLAQIPAVVQPYGQAGFVPTGTGIPPQFSEVTPIPIQQNSQSLAAAQNFSTGVPGSWAGRTGLTPAMNIAGTYLDNLQVDFLVRATQANSRTALVQAPRLVLFNGQRANISVGRVQQYVASVRPIVAEGVVGFQPIPAAAFSGTTLDVEGTISADRKYVTVTIRTAQLKDPIFNRFEVQRGSGNSPSVFITLLDQETTSVNTTISIPDGGTVLLGGLKQAGEVEVEAGVPILSKIPVLKRAFTNTSSIKDVQTLLILIKAKVIIQRESEEEAFPTLVTSETG